MRAVLTKCLMIVAVASVAACAAPQTKVFPDITFSHLPPISIAVDEKSTLSAFQSSYTMPYVEHEMPVLPEAVLRQWAADRLVPSGEGSARLVYTILDASVTAKALSTDETLKAWFTDEQAVKYEVSLKAEVKIDDSANGASGVAEASAKRSVTVPEGATVNERNQTLFDLISAAAGDFNTQLEANVRRYLANWVR